jgi:hypothetical protein
MIRKYHISFSLDGRVEPGLDVLGSLAHESFAQTTFQKTTEVSFDCAGKNL